MSYNPKGILELVVSDGMEQKKMRNNVILLFEFALQK